MNRNLLLGICIALCLSLSVNSQTIIGRQTAEQFPVNAWGGTAYALTWLPQSYNNTSRDYPLIIFLHGAGETGTTITNLSKLINTGLPNRIANGFNAVAVNPRTGLQDSFIVVSPQAASWSYSYTELKHILPAIINKYRVDRRRIYLTGLSAGGGGTFSTFGSRDSLFIKNFAAMATASSAGTNASNGYTYTEVEEGIKLGSAYGVRMWTVAGDQDFLIDTDVKYHNYSNFFNPNPKNKLTVIQGVGHSSWNQMYNPVFRPTVNFYGNIGACNNGCNNGGIPMAPNNNGSTVRGSGVTQDSLNVYEWFLMYKRNDTEFSPNIGDYRSDAPKPTGGRWNNSSFWRRYDGVNWVTTSIIPNGTNGIISISANDSLEIDASLTVNQLQITTGGVLSVQSANLTIDDGPGTDMVVNGKLILSDLRAISGLGKAEINGIFDWKGGTLAINTIAGTTAFTNVTGNFNKTLSANFINNGTFNWSSGLSAGNILFANAAFTNNGVVNESFSSNKGITPGGGTNAFINAGTFRKLSNFTFLNNALPFTNSGILQGVGAYNFTSGSLTNTGTIKPGNSPGVLSINDAGLSGQSSTISIEIFNGSGAGTGHNMLDLTGNINLTGNRLNIIDNFAAPQQSYTVLTTTGTISGTFSQTTLPPGYTLTYSSNNVTATKGSATLPALWGNFEAKMLLRTVKLNWNTLQEQNTSHFVIEHSEDGRNYLSIGNVQAQGNSSSTAYYEFLHESPSNIKTNFYRLRLVDLDGKENVSQIRAVKQNIDKDVFQMLSNVVSGDLRLNIFTDQLHFKIVDMAGRVYLMKTINNGFQTLPVSSLPGGLYKITALKNNQPIQTSSFIKN
jgi:predicted esterase